ncbi:DUF4238 domain-containing protein [Arthrobacter sp. SA17]
MPLHHYLPAAYLGGFSDSDSGSRRTRPVWCYRRGSNAPFKTNPSRIGAVRDLYTLTTSPDPDDLDKVWSYYEARLPTALKALITGPAALDGATWLRVLVPFVAALFVRGKEFEHRYLARTPHLVEALKARGNFPDDSANQARKIELQRLLAPVTAAHWGILHASFPDVPFLTNDLALGAVRTNLAGSTHAYLVPLDANHALTIAPAQDRPVLAFDGYTWRPILDRLEVAPDDVRQINPPPLLHRNSS